MNTLGSSKRNLTLSMICIALAGWASYSVAQQTRPQPSRNEAGRRDAPANLDGHMASCLILGNQNEIAAVRIAEKKAENAEVRNFAENMATDHQRFINELDKFALNTYRSRETQEASPARTPAAASGPVPAPINRKAAVGQSREVVAAEAGDHPPHMARFMKIREEIADQCRASLQREFDTKHGKAFDECFMGMQIGFHMQLVDELTVLEKHASPEFQPILRQQLAMAQKHFDEAKQVMNDVKDEQTASAKTTTTETD